MARTFGHPDVLRLLMDRSPDAVNLAESCLAGDEMTWRTLLRTTPDLARTLSADDTRRLPDAAEENDATAVRLLLAAGWPVDARGDQGATALHWAAWHGNLEMAREILRFNPTVDLKSVQFDSTALQWARHGSDHGWRPGIGDHAAVIELLRSIGATDAAI